MPVPTSYCTNDSVLPAAIIHSKLVTASLPPLSNNEAIIDRILQIITNYLLTTGPDDQFISTGRGFLRAQIERYAAQNKPLELVLPAFPFKSPSSKKVLGTLPDLAEEVFLRRLEDLCLSIEDVYGPGAQLKIVSDGIVYSQLLGVTDSTAYRYNAELRRMVKDLKLSHINFVRVQELISNKHQTGDIVDMSEDDYVVQAPKTREAFLATDIGNWDVEEQIKTDEGTLRTYRGYLRFLKLDLESQQHLGVEGDKGGPSFQRLSRKAKEKVIGNIAKEMMGNGARFSSLVSKSFPTAIRLSIHPHTNAGPKFALRIFSDVELACTPWHNVSVMKRDGSFGIQHSHTVNRATHELVYRRGRPYYWREIDPAMQWGDHMGVMFDRLFPYGLLIRPVPGAVIPWNDVPMDKMRDLASRYSLVLARGFGPVDKEEYRQKAREMGTILPWVWGDILEVKEDPNMDLNNTTTRESMPFHFDGVFKTKTNDDGSVTADPPQFQVFQCRQAPSADDPATDAGGRTLFSSTALIYSQVIANNISPHAEDIKNRKWTVFTPTNKSFGGQPLELPLVETNPLSGRKGVRWHEEWPQHITQHKPTTCHIVGTDDELSTKIGNHITELLYDRRFCLQQTWLTGDYMIADNFELMHTRTAFNPCPRELWRIHVN